MKQLPDHTVFENVFNASEELSLKDKILFEDLSASINHLIVHDFERLVSILYRLDVDEKKLEYLLAQKNDINASDTIAALIIERQVQKIKSRQKNRRDTNHIAEEDKW